jgi:septal ring factor EnvC (AmiA/AmiB activator)
MASNHGGVISRSPEVNAEVHSVRNQIRTKQFELERLQQASGSFVSSQSTPTKNTIPTAKQISELKDDIKKLQSRLDRLIGASSGGERYPSSSEASRRSRMSEYAESRESRESLVTRVHIPTTPAARSVQSYQSPLLSSSQKKRIDLPEDTTKRDESIVPCPPHWLQRYPSSSLSFSYCSTPLTTAATGLPWPPGQT